MKYTFLLILLVNTLESSSQFFSWATSGGGPLNDEAFCIRGDASGNINITGMFTSSATIADSNLTGNGQSDMFVAQYDNIGNGIWANAGTGTMQASSGHVLSSDNVGNIYVVGEFTDTLILGSTTLISNGLADVFIAKYSNSGSLSWAISAGGSGEEGGNSIRTDANGNVYITGYFSDTAAFGSIPVISNGGRDIFVLKLNSLGNPVWCTPAGGINDDEGRGIDVNQNSEIHITGYFNDTATFGSHTITSANPQRDMFVSKLNPTGIFQWALKGGGTGIDVSYEVTSSATSTDVYVTGSFQNTAYFGVTSVTSAGGDDVFLACVNALGNFTWVQTAGGPNNDKAYALTMDNINGTIGICGSFDSIISFGGHQRNGFGDKDVFVAAYHTNGLYLTSLVGGGPGFDRAYGITGLGSYFFITGTFEQTATFGALNITSAGAYDLFVVGVSGLNAIHEKDALENSWIINMNPSASPEIIFNEKRHGQLRIYSTSGVLNKTIDLNGQKKIIPDMQGSSNGLYLVQYISEKGETSTRRFIKTQ